MGASIKMIENKKKIEVFLVAGILVIMLCFLVSAIGFSYGYHPTKNPLEVYPGETKNVQVLLQTAKTEEVKAEAILLEDGGIASIGDEEYLISSEKNAPVNVRLRIPANAVIGHEYTVKLEFKEINPSEAEGGMVGLTASSAALTMHVFVVEKPPEEKPEEKIGIGWILLVIVLVVVVIVVLYFIIKSKKGMSAETTKPTK